VAQFKAHIPGLCLDKNPMPREPGSVGSRVRGTGFSKDMIRPGTELNPMQRSTALKQAPPPPVNVLLRHSSLANQRP